MNDKQIKQYIFIAGVVQSVITAIIGVVAFVYTQGKASADVVHKPDLVMLETKVDNLKQDLGKVKEDTAYIRGYLDKKP